MEPFTPDTSASDNSRRAAAMSVIASLIQRGYDADQRHRLKNNMSMGYADYQQLREVMEYLDAYTTETLEYTAALRSSPQGPRPYLHRIFREMEHWGTVTKEHKDMMFRDVISLRRITIPLHPWDAYGFFEVYKVTGIGAGKLHELGWCRERDVAEALILAVRISRMAEQKGLREAIKGEWKDHPYGDSIREMRKQITESPQRDHLTEEWIQYFTDFPERRSSVCDFLLEKRLPLSEVSPQFYDEYTAAHTTMKAGVL